MFARLSVLCALALTFLLPAAATAQVRATLVAEVASIQPGQPFNAALRLQHEGHWHTYWINPGTGLATTLTWTLPAGFTASDIRWPVPTALRDRGGNVIGNGYEGDILLPVTITPPADLAPGTNVTLKVYAEWLMCEDTCIPGDANLQLTLPVAAGPAAPHPTFGERVTAAVARLPRPDPAWQVTATKAGGVITLAVKAAQASDHVPQDLHFFADDNLVGYDLPQTVSPDGQGGFVLTLRIAADADANATELHGVLAAKNGWRADGSLPALRVEVPFEADEMAATAAETVTSDGVAGTAATGLVGTLALAFIGGLILNLMPCVFPVLGIKILGFVNQAGSDRRKVVMHGLTFTLGVLLSFWVLAGALAILRAGGDQLGWGFQLQSAGFVFALTVLLLVFALNMSGVFEFGLGATGVGAGLQMKDGYAGSFFTGVLATVVATPCSAPFLAPALGAALALPTTESFVIFTAIALGLSAPYLLLSLFPAAIKVLPRPGAWMETFKQFMAFPLYATVGYLVWVLAGQVSEPAFLITLFSLVLIALAAWFYGRWNAPGASAGRARFGLASGTALLAAGLWLGWPAAPAQAAAEGETGYTLTWEDWSPAAVEKYRAEGRTIYVDFTARWCFTCQTNKAAVFGSAEVLRYFAEHNIVALKADWTNKDPRITTELAKYQRSAIPFNLIWLPGRTEPVILPELLTPGIVLDALKG
ncbi:MAG: thioredoxin family protein [Opitutaceae bacterium]|nr:thioredoxin family protein [Opitutaceae bacterium]